MRGIFSFIVLLGVRSLSQIFYRTQLRWIGTLPQHPFGGLRLIVLLNHTSLFEPLYLSQIPLPLLWRIATCGSFPGANITLDRPITGRFFKVLAPHVAAITRERDASWSSYLDSIKDDTLVFIAPEGRMKRPSGLDKHGNPMTVRGGIADLLASMHSGAMLIAYSGGLHHVHTPGRRLPHLFKRLYLSLEQLDIAAYCQSLGSFDMTTPEGLHAFKRAVITDLEKRRDRECSVLESKVHRDHAL